MSIGFQISRASPKSNGIFGWQFTDDSSVDLTNWSIAYKRDRILCRPKPVEFFYMMFGTVFFLALTIGLLSIVFGFRLPNIVHLDSKVEPHQTFLMASLCPRPFLTQNSGQSRHQQRTPSAEDIRAGNQRLRSNMLESKSDQKRQGFDEQPIEQAKVRVVENKLTEKATRSQSTDRILDGLFLFGKVVTFFISLISAAIALACLRRAILFFANQLEIRVSNRNLCLVRPRLFGGVKKKAYPLVSMGPIHCRAIQAGSTTLDQESFGVGYTVWTVVLMSRSKEMLPLEFKIEQTVTGSAVRPTSKAIKFANGLRDLTGLPLDSGNQR